METDDDAGYHRHHAKTMARQQAKKVLADLLVHIDAMGMLLLITLPQHQSCHDLQQNSRQSAGTDIGCAAKQGMESKGS